MMITITLLYIILWSTVPTLSYMFDCETAVAVKKGIQDYSDSIVIGASGFKDLIKRSKVFVDKTLLVKQILYFRHKVTVVVCPRKWGKSINLDILRTYFEIQVDRQGNPILPLSDTTNNRLFRNGEIVLDDGRVQRLEAPLLIQKYPFMMEQFQGRHPVIYLTLKDVVGSSYEEIKERLYWAIGRTFEHHKYLLNWLGEEDKHEFKCILHHEKCAKTPTVTRIPLLCKFLRNHFNSSVVILMDDYDAPLKSAFQINDFPQKNETELLSFYVSLLGYMFDGNEHLMKGIIVGVFEIGERFFEGNNSYTVYSIAKNPASMLQFFGFHQENVEKLFQLHNITGDLAEQAHRWYGGYVATAKNELDYYRPFYNPSSIAYFLRNKKIASYWEENGCIDVFDNILTNSPYTRKALFELISKYKRHALGQLKLERSIFPLFRELLHKKQLHYINEEYQGPHRDTAHLDVFEHHISAFMEYLFSKGLLAAEPTRLELRFNLVYVPNNEIAFEIAKRLIYVYKKIFHISQDLLQDVVPALLSFVRDDEDGNKFIEQSLENQYEGCESQMCELRTDITYGDDSPEYSIFNCITLQMQCMTKFEIDVYYREQLDADIVIVDHKRQRGVIIEFVFTNGSVSPYDILSQAEEYEYVFNNFTNIKRIKFITVNVQPNRTVNIAARLKNKGKPKPVKTTTPEYKGSSMDFGKMCRAVENYRALCGEKHVLDDGFF